MFSSAVTNTEAGEPRRTVTSPDVATVNAVTPGTARSSVASTPLPSTMVISAPHESRNAANTSLLMGHLRPPTVTLTPAASGRMGFNDAEEHR